MNGLTFPHLTPNLPSSSPLQYPSPPKKRYIAEVRATDGKPAHRSAASVLNDDLSILAHLPRDTPPSVALVRGEGGVFLHSIYL